MLHARACSPLGELGGEILVLLFDQTGRAPASGWLTPETRRLTLLPQRCIELEPARFSNEKQPWKA